MYNVAINALKSAIVGKYRLRPVKGGWRIKDQFTTAVKLVASPENSFGFSLDKDDPKNRPFRFFTNSPPRGVARMCDAIVALHYGGKLYFFIIEQKTAHEGDFENQLANGKFFCEWLVNVLGHYDHCNPATVEYIGLLVWEPYPMPSKQTTSPPAVSQIRHPLFGERCFEAANETSIPLERYIIWCLANGVH